LTNLRRKGLILELAIFAGHNCVEIHGPANNTAERSNHKSQRQPPAIDSHCVQTFADTADEKGSTWICRQQIIRAFEGDAGQNAEYRCKPDRAKTHFLIIPPPTVSPY